MKYGQGLWLGLWLGLCLSGCHVIQQGYEKVRKSGTEAVKLSRYRYDFKVVSTDTLNPGEEAKRLATHLQIYQLQDKALFEQASYYDLLNQAESVLGKDLLKQQMIALKPFDTQRVRGEIDQRSQYIGLVFFFNQPTTDEHSWKLLVPLKDIHLLSDNYILANGNQAKLVKKKAVKDELKEQKKAEKEQKKANKERQKAEKAEKAKQKADKAKQGAASKATTGVQDKVADQTDKAAGSSTAKTGKSSADATAQSKQTGKVVKTAATQLEAAATKAATDKLIKMIPK